MKNRSIYFAQKIECTVMCCLVSYSVAQNAFSYWDMYHRNIHFPADVIFNMPHVPRQHRLGLGQHLPHSGRATNSHAIDAGSSPTSANHIEEFMTCPVLHVECRIPDIKQNRKKCLRCHVSSPGWVVRKQDSHGCGPGFAPRPVPRLTKQVAPFVQA